MTKLFYVFVFFAGFTLSAQQKTTVKSPKGPWKMVNEQSIPSSGIRYIQAKDYLTFKLDLLSLKSKLASVKRYDDPLYIPVFIELPKPDGGVGYYQVYENETMSIGLAEKFPEIRSYDGIATDNSGEVVKFDLTPQGFHAMTLVPGKPTLFIDPYAFGPDIEHYIVYAKDQYISTKEFSCDVTESFVDALNKGTNVPVKSYGNCTKRTYRLALSATGEYTTFHGGTVALAQAAQVTTMNRVNGVYMRDFAVTMSIIANNNLIIYTNSSTDPFSNGNPGSMITQNQSNTTTVIGSANYDIGHVFGTNSGGLAGLGVVCNSSQKARGVTGSGAPIGDPFDIDYVAHEIGHQHGGNHTFAGSTGSCAGGNANLATGYEPGSGSTIMAYAGICSPNDIQPNSDDHFHTGTFIEVHNFLTGAGSGCGVATAISAQSAPTVTVAGGSYTIPINTPFALTASATDPDGDVLTYCWEQMNNNTTVNVPTATQTAGPNFRSRTPSLSPTRYFPTLSSLTGGAASTFEVLPSVNRTMSFKCLVRDNELGGGCNDEATVSITTTTSAGPFIVNYPTNTGITWPGNSSQTVTWSVANTNVAPVSCANVDILISTDGGATFTNIADNVPNDGSQVITVPNTSTTTAIIMVICENGTFFDVSNNVFTITAATNDYTLSLSNNAISACQGSNATYTVQVGQIGAYSDPVNLSVTGNPVGTTVNFSPNPVIPGNTSTLTISNTGGATPGAYNLTITGNSTSGTHTTSGSLLISTNGASASTLTSPANGAASAPIQTVLTWSNPGAGLLFDVTIATDASFTNIVETATGLTTTTYTAQLLSPGTTYYWKVSTYNSCTSAVVSSVFSYTTASCVTFNSTNIPVTISASGTPTVTSTLNIPTNGTINDLNVVNLAGTHTWISDLTITLTSPGGTTVTLFSNVCDNEDNFNLNFDDEASTSTLPCPPIGGGNYIPTGALSGFDGQNMAGNWTLTITDAFNQDGGALNSWGLQVCYTPLCLAPDAATVSGTNAICTGNSTTLSVGSANLNDATSWEWYTGSCGGTLVGTGTSLTVSPTTTTTYYVRGVGGCVTPGTCTSYTVTVNSTIPSTPNVTVVNNCGNSVLSSSGSSLLWSNGGTGNTITVTSAGTFTVTQTVGGCTSSAGSGVAAPLTLPTVTMAALQPVCINSPAFALTGGSPAGGSYSGTGVSGNNFNPSVAGFGTFSIVYTYTASNGCSASNQTTISVGCAGLDENANADLIISPNPTSGTFKIDAGDQMLQNVTIYDPAGRLVHSTETFNQLNVCEVDMTEFAVGFYQVIVRTEQKVYVTRLLLNK